MYCYSHHRHRQDRDLLSEHVSNINTQNTLVSTSWKPPGSNIFFYNSLTNMGVDITVDC